ncbi:hypothetical protein E6P09_08995 [Haloferax mediterranei ATCC 33500]|uniref:Uncharacterized protein n=1 Tax=Haloferax mediterranei (strain ATCC 33500 / DSM 1411 / JCM 8866 / NBRC 14739 / NCIMB 2177 / R-4) TaxID=523841 RepID=I3R3U9_HALMT|nr:hypothetical protein [Haloferax mediterranei]AFK18909.1 hypothetical protein HFX_1196 [Haloferax mediterranei ATCC 33500]AHZ21727.1 hypothetical protein BM92_03215 [Haloferax mediterranei ATCC 33500]EMA03232.1 hypothetical protein C439_04520 [Haloferax mediterranei ATCC 33500]MDX5989002.1 hypothetical protein [Haloferax mediterranei ATCC 33500]QCQ75395.1 hypothetical protein E6P09_08995 [Haloferax mediterranei ATCC 33500]
METKTVQSDKSIGFAALFGVLTLVGAGLMVAGPDQLTKALGFAVAITAASLAVGGAHAFQ